MQMIRLPVMRLDWDEFTKKQNKAKKNGNLKKKKNPLDPIQKKQVWKINEWLPAHTTQSGVCLPQEYRVRCMR